jgi:predicted AlkP superfamily phosphohydrolase/phosphomutase
MHTLIIGLDAFDPTIFERLYEQGRVPNLGKYVQEKGYAPFAVSNPPQSEVSWTSIATGLNPGSHGLFDFVHRNPATYAAYPSLLPKEKGFLGGRFVRPFNARTLFDQAVGRGYPATTLWWPATFPAKPQSPVQTLPGLGTPDLLGRLGVGSFFTNDGGDKARQEGKIPVGILERQGTGRFAGIVAGPVRKKLFGGAETTAVEFELEQTGEETAVLTIDGQRIALQVGRWSNILALSFKIGSLFSAQAITQFILTQLEPDVSLYALPLQLHPRHSPWPYGTPGRFVKESWDNCGPFLTLGWPQDTTALEEGLISDEQFLALCEAIEAARLRVLLHHIDNFKEGVLACVFDSLDRIQHMFWRERPDIIEAWYEKLDGLVGVVAARLQERGLKDNVRLLIVSDHGFTNFDYKVHLNRWLLEQGFMTSQEKGANGTIKQVDWSQSRAYALGLNSIYLNLHGREGEGIVLPENKEALRDELCRALSQWRGPDGRPVVQRAAPGGQVFDGPLSSYGPDIVVGYAPGYRASQETGLGNWQGESLLPNHDHWSGDHCIDPAAVPGVIFTNPNLLRNFPAPSYRDIPAIAIDAAPDGGDSTPPPTIDAGEDEKVIEERLRGLGYL